MIEWILLQIQAVPKIETGTPTSIGAWIGMLSGGTALILLAYDRFRGSGKREADLTNKVADLCRQVETLERELTTIEVNLGMVDRKLSEVLYELRGVDGLNGIKGANRNQATEIAAIQKRLAAMDVVAALLKAERDNWKGDERRVSSRRTIDSKLLDLATGKDEGNE